MLLGSKALEPPEQAAEAEACGGEDGIDAVAVARLEFIALHQMFGLKVADDGPSVRTGLRPTARARA